MDRDIGIEESRNPEHPRPVSDTNAPAGPLSREREPVDVKGHRYHVSPSEMAALHEIGRFRTILTADLLRFQYRGQKDHLREDFELLSAQGLIRERTISTNAKTKLSLVVLTKSGRELLRQKSPREAHQAFYAGFVKPREIVHDAAIYRMYRAEAERIAKDGGRVRRVILDYEIKQKVYRPLAKIRPHVTKQEYAKRQAEVAQQNGLKVTGGKILLPDLRIEYETRSGASGAVDLELATEHYRGGMIRGKMQAGFKLYAPAGSASRLAAHDPELMADILSF
jgi:hypothetical protein